MSVFGKPTKKEQEVIAQMRENPLCTRKEIAEKLFNSPHTIDMHFNNIYKHFGVSGPNAKRDLLTILDDKL